MHGDMRGKEGLTGTDNRTTVLEQMGPPLSPSPSPQRGEGRKTAAEAHTNFVRPGMATGGSDSLTFQS